MVPDILDWADKRVHCLHRIRLRGGKARPVVAADSMRSKCFGQNGSHTFSVAVNAGRMGCVQILKCTGMDAVTLMASKLRKIITACRGASKRSVHFRRS